MIASRTGHRRGPRPPASMPCPHDEHCTCTFVLGPEAFRDVPPGQLPLSVPASEVRQLQRLAKEALTKWTYSDLNVAGRPDDAGA